MSAAPLPAAAVRATVLGADAASLRTAGEMLRAGKLVAFPTETVYGLGANALDEEAVLDIFRVKGRPLTDPLIVHIPTPDAAAALFETDDETAAVVAILAAAFWPGPLTLVARAASSLPLCVSAGTGFVGVRCPDHAVARALLAEAAVPVAAPSANRFGHVSPTSAQVRASERSRRGVRALRLERMRLADGG
jgi:tRNA threonylcarbamoyl adenosine modification protein (Sua5/YciO/YrdC/YwlC family)